MSRRLFSRARRPSDADASPARAQSSSSLSTLPSYQPPSCPLNDAGRRALGELSNNRGTLLYETQLKDSTRHLGLCVGDLHERLGAQQDRLRNLRERRREKGTDKTAEEERLEAHLIELEKDVEELTQDSEEALREVIDHRAELQDQTVILGDLYTNAATSATGNVPSARESRKRARDQQDQAAEDQLITEGSQEDQKEAPAPVVSIKDSYLAAMAQKQTEYVALSPHERYALNNDYAAFKKIWHDAAAGEDGPPLPDASRWFRSDGRPVMSRPGASSNRRSTIGAADDEDDDDIAVAREVLSLNCPLSLKQMEQPYSNVKCKHTFEKAALMEYLPARGTVQCPQSGCSQIFSRAEFNRDFFLDEAMMRRIQRTKQTQRDIDNMDEDDDEDETGDESLVMGHERRGAGRPMKQER